MALCECGSGADCGLTCSQCGATMCENCSYQDAEELLCADCAECVGC